MLISVRLVPGTQGADTERVLRWQLVDVGYSDPGRGVCAEGPCVTAEQVQLKDVNI